MLSLYTVTLKLYVFCHQLNNSHPLDRMASGLSGLYSSPPPQQHHLLLPLPQGELETSVSVLTSLTSSFWDLG